MAQVCAPGPWQSGDCTDHPGWMEGREGRAAMGLGVSVEQNVIR